VGEECCGIAILAWAGELGLPVKERDELSLGSCSLLAEEGGWHPSQGKRGSAIKVGRGLSLQETVVLKKRKRVDLIQLTREPQGKKRGARWRGEDLLNTDLEEIRREIKEVGLWGKDRQTGPSTKKKEQKFYSLQNLRKREEIQRWKQRKSKVTPAVREPRLS